MNTTPELDSELLAEIVESVRAVIAQEWPDATHAARGDLTRLWQKAAEQGWTDLGELGLGAAIAVQEQLGRVASPLPVVDVFLVTSVLGARGDRELVERIGAGEVRPVIAMGSLHDAPVARWVEAAPAATHALIVDEEEGTLAWFDLTGAAVEVREGLPAPAWAEVRPSAPAQWSAPLAEHPQLAPLRRLGLAARAVAAFARTHELAVEHAKTRHQFGKAIGAFQAVSHRLVNAQTTLTAAAELLSHAVQLITAEDGARHLATDLYTEFVAAELAQLQFGAHHTLAASGYFEESEGPWLFRRMHADLGALSAHRAQRVGDRVIGERLPEWGRDASAQRVREEVLRAFEPWLDGAPSHLSTWDDDAREVLRARDWIGVGWPESVGGGGWPITDVIAFSEAIAYVNPPLGNIWMGVNSIVPMLVKVGPEPLRDLVIDEVRKGDLSIALGYSEPDAGSDLASLRTRAERVDGGWVINGQKSWGTSFPDSRWVVVAARTDPEATPPHAGISLFLVDTDSPGITSTDHTSLAGDVSSTTFWDDVFVPDDRLIGLPNEGWKALMAALAGERALIGASVMRAHRSFEKLVALAADPPQGFVAGRPADFVREVGRLAIRLQAARALVNRAVRATTQGGGDRTEAPMAKIAATEFAEDLHSTAIAVLGPHALSSWGTPEALGDGYFEDGLRASIMGVVAGGTGDIQRNLVARGMGLPR